MANKRDEFQLRRMNRRQLIEIIYALQKKNKELGEERDQLKQKLDKKGIAISNAGSIAEASLNLSGIFENAQQAADEYLASVKASSGANRSLNQVSSDANAQASKIVAEAQMRASEIQKSANGEAKELVAKADEQSQAILEDAKQQAQSIIEDAHIQADIIIENANVDAQAIINSAAMGMPMPVPSMPPAGFPMQPAPFIDPGMQPPMAIDPSMQPPLPFDAMGNFIDPNQPFDVNNFDEFNGLNGFSNPEGFYDEIPSENPLMSPSIENAVEAEELPYAAPQISEDEMDGNTLQIPVPDISISPA